TAGQRQNPGGAQQTGSAAAKNGGDTNAQASDGANGGNAAAQQGDAPAAQQAGARAQFYPSTAPVLPGQLRRVWVLGADGKPQPRRIKIGLSDGSSTEVVEGDLREGDVVVTGQNVTASSPSRAQNNSHQSTAPGFGGAPTVAGPGGGR